MGDFCRSRPIMNHPNLNFRLSMPIMSLKIVFTLKYLCLSKKSWEIDIYYKNKNY